MTLLARSTIRSVLNSPGGFYSLDFTNRILSNICAVAVPMAGSMAAVNVNYGRGSTPGIDANGTVGIGIDSYLGFVGTISTFSNYHFFNIPAMGTIWHKGTMAAILRPSGGLSAFLTNGTGTIGAHLEVSGGFLSFRKNESGSGSNVTSSIPIVSGAPFFVAVSWDDSISVEFVLRRLDTGQTYYDRVADTTAITVTADSSPGARNNSSNLNVAGMAFSGTINLSKQELLQWAADPWSFWYPAQPIIFPGTVSTVFMRPDADFTDGSWLNELGTNTNLFASVDETPFSDSDYIQSQAANDKVRLRLSDPAGGAGLATPMTVSYRCNSINTSGGTIIGRLFQGSTQIATWSTAVNNAPTNYTYTLSPGELSSITDPTDLYVEFEYSP